jgi:hypothetical protein
MILGGSLPVCRLPLSLCQPNALYEVLRGSIDSGFIGYFSTTLAPWVFVF